MKILVTGCAGFIGSHVSERLVQDGHAVVGVDNFDSFYSPETKEKNVERLVQQENFALHRGDIRDDIFLRSLFAQNAFDRVIHLAARAGVRPSIEQPALYYDVNVRGTLCLLEVMRQFNTKRFIFASSSSVYGNNQVPFRESDSVDHPISPYAATKKAGELLCYTYHKLYGIHTFCLRFFTVYGPRQRPEMAISSFTNSILQGKTLKLFAQGESSRDYTFIEDIVAGVMAANDRVQGYEIINLGESSPIKLIGLVRLLERSTGRSASLEFLPGQPGDVESTYASIAKARNILDYKPRFSIQDGIDRYVDWHLNSSVGSTRE